MRPQFSLLQSHLDLAHSYWQRLVKPGDVVIDATAGNGKDSVILAQLALTPTAGKLIILDIQEMALHSTMNHLKNHVDQHILHRVTAIEKCHSEIDTVAMPFSCALIVYNLGYLPGGDKKITTQAETTIKSIERSLELIQPGGVISITCYPGHEAGRLEQEKLINYCETLNKDYWSCIYHRWINRPLSPALILIQKAIEYSSV